MIDLPDFYVNEGYVGRMLEDALRRRPEIIFGVRVGIYFPGVGYAGTVFFSRGEWRADAVSKAKGDIANLSEIHNISIEFPSDWEAEVTNTDGMGYRFEQSGNILHIGAFSLTRVAEIAAGGNVTNPKWDDKEKGIYILDRADFLTEFRGSIADQFLNASKYCDASAIPQPPNEECLQGWIKEAGEVYDHYIAIPSGSLIVTKDFIFPFVFGRKNCNRLKWDSNCAWHSGYSSREGPRIPTTDPCVHFTGVENDCAPHMMKNPVLRADFSFSFDFVKWSSVVPKVEEKSCVAQAIDVMGGFESIWVQNPPRGLQGVSNSHHPTKDELIAMANFVLEIAAS